MMGGQSQNNILTYSGTGKQERALTQRSHLNEAHSTQQYPVSHFLSLVAF